MSVTVAFLDESTLRFCPTSQVQQIIEIDGYNFFINEEVIEGVRRLHCASWIDASLNSGRITSHQIAALDDIQLLAKVMKCCGLCRGEICSYMAAKREGGIVVAEDPRTGEILKRHIPGVQTVNPQDFLQANSITISTTVALRQETLDQRSLVAIRS